MEMIRERYEEESNTKTVIKTVVEYLDKKGDKK